jgi:hypothetical protein
MGETIAIIICKFFAQRSPFFARVVALSSAKRMISAATAMIDGRANRPAVDQSKTVRAAAIPKSRGICHRRPTAY